MKAINLGGDDAPCILVSLTQHNSQEPAATVMFDCALALSHLQQFSLPSSAISNGRAGSAKNEGQSSGVFCCTPALHAVDLAAVDVVLISNYRSMLALPYVTEYSAFRGRVYAAEPTIQMGRHLMTEFVQLHSKADGMSGIPRSHPCADHARDAYTVQDVEACLARICPLSFSQRVEIYPGLVCRALSSGYCIGAANWVLETYYHKIAFMAATSAAPSRHPQLMDFKELAADVVVVTQLNPAPHRNPNEARQEMLSRIGSTLEGGGTVILPVDPTGMLLDLLDDIDAYLKFVGKAHIPMVLVSRQSENSLAYANIVAEWLNEERQANVFIPRPPFDHAALLEDGRLVHYPAATDPAFVRNHLQKGSGPSIIFAGHSSMRFGDVVPLVRVLGTNPLNALVLTDPQTPMETAVSPLQPLAMHVYHCPIDPRLSPQDLGSLLAMIPPSHLVLPKRHYQGSEGQRVAVPSASHVYPLEDTPGSYVTLDRLSPPAPPALVDEDRFERAVISSEVAGNLPVQLQAVGGGHEAHLAGVAGVLERLPTGMYRFTPGGDKKEGGAQPSCCGVLTPENVVTALHQAGVILSYGEVRCVGTTTGHAIHLAALRATVHVHAAANSSVIDAPDEETRQLLLRAVSSALTEFVPMS